MADSPSTGRRAQPPLAKLWPILLLWAAAWLWLGRLHMLDDALIHLRFADRLASAGFVTYDGVDPSYGTSSLLYVGILAVLRTFSASALLPKVVSVAVYLGLLGWLLRRASTCDAGGTWCALAVALCGPLSNRWLTDGMETGCTIAASLCFVELARGMLAPTRRLTDSALAFGLAATVVLLRIELSALVACMTLAALVERLTDTPGATLKDALRRAAPALLGVCVALAGIRLGTGYLLPDTAVAKAMGRHFAVSQLVVVAASMASAGTFGVGFLLVWATSAFAAWKRSRERRTSLLALGVANSLFPALCLLIFARGQASAVRYLVWPLVASVAWNAGVLERSSAGEPDVFMRRVWAGLTMLLLTAALVESPTVMRIFQGRSATLVDLQRARFAGLYEQVSVAGDIGMFGYFSRTRVCDLSGLINGRAFAKLSPEQRAQQCSLRHPTVAFVDALQIEQLRPWLDLSQWHNCGSVDFPNVRGSEPHALLLEPSARLDCPPGFVDLSAAR